MVQLNTEELIGRTTLRDIIEIMNKGIEVLKMRDEIVPYVVELGVEGRLTAMQLKEITDDIEEVLTIFVMDYCQEHIAEVAVPAMTSGVKLRMRSAKA